MEVIDIKYKVKCDCGCIFTDDYGVTFKCPFCELEAPMGTAKWLDTSDEEA